MYEREINEVSTFQIQVNAKEGSDMRGIMERKRVTPNIYENCELVEGICFNVCSQAFREISDVGAVGMAPARSSESSERSDEEDMDDDSVFGELCDQYESENI